MACPGGCIGGGGQPYPHEGYRVLDPALLRKRAAALYSIDSGKKLRKSYENPAVEEVYEAFLGGPGSEKAHKLLHTRYRPNSPEACDEPASRHHDRQLGTRPGDGPRSAGGAAGAVHRGVPRRGAAGEPSHRRAAPGANAIRLPEPDPSRRRGATAGGAGGQGGRRGQLLPFLPPGSRGANTSSTSAWERPATSTAPTASPSG